LPELESGASGGCPSGFHLSGLERTDQTYNNMLGLQELKQAKCCRTATTSKVHGCADVITGPMGAWSECPHNAAIVGLKSKITQGSDTGTSPTPPETPRHATTNDGVYLGGRYVQVGVRKNDQIGKVGTDGANGVVPSGFHRRQLPDPSLRLDANNSWGIGYMGNARGFDNDHRYTIDYFLPGREVEGFYLGYTKNGIQNTCNNTCGNSVEDITQANSDTASLRIKGRLGTLNFTSIFSLRMDDTYLKVEVNLENTGTSALNDVRFMRSVDPDNTVDVTLAQGDFNTADESGRIYRTKATILKTVTWDGYSAVSAESQSGDSYASLSGGKHAKITYFSRDPTSRASFGKSNNQWAPTGVYDPNTWESALSKYSTKTTDSWISMAFRFAQIPAGESRAMTYFISMDDRPIDEIIDELVEDSKPSVSLDSLRCCEFPPAAVIDAGGCR